MKKKVLCTAMAVTILLTQTVSAAPWWLSKYRVTFDNELGIMGDVTLQFASDGGLRLCVSKQNPNHLIKWSAQWNEIARG